MSIHCCERLWLCYYYHRAFDSWIGLRESLRNYPIQLELGSKVKLAQLNHNSYPPS